MFHSIIYRDFFGGMQNVPPGSEDFRLKQMMLKKGEVFDGTKEEAYILFFHKDKTGILQELDHGVHKPDAFCPIHDPMVEG